MVTFDGVSKVLNGVNLTIHKGDLLGLVGETGCGKSVTAMTIPRLVPQPPARYPRGEVIFRGENMLEQARQRTARDARQAYRRRLSRPDDRTESGVHD